MKDRVAASLTATEALQAMDGGRLSAVVLAASCLDRTTEREWQVRAWSHLNPGLVRDQARGREATERRGLLHGIPIGIKDVILTRDMPTQHNSELYQGSHPVLDAACVSTLRAAGAVIFGKTDTVEFAATGRRALTRNPHDLTRTPGGSSSGSAAAVADGHVPIALGTQTGGSIIRPASYCGVWALKPTWGLVSREGVRQFAPTLDTVGWFARSADDLSLLLRLFGEAQITEPFSLCGARIAICRTPMWDQAEPATRTAITTAEAQLQAAGAIVTDLSLPAPFDRLPELHTRIMRAEGGVSFLPEYRMHGDGLEQSLRDMVLNKDGTSRAELLEAYDIAAACRPQFDELASGYDAILTPSTTGEAPVGLTVTGSLIFNGLWTLLHVPCVNIPGLRGPTGLPVGLTLTAPRFSDARLVMIARAVGALLS